MVRNPHVVPIKFEDLCIVSLFRLMTVILSPHWFAEPVTRVVVVFNRLRKQIRWYYDSVIQPVEPRIRMGCWPTFEGQVCLFENNYMSELSCRQYIVEIYRDKIPVRVCKQFGGSKMDNKPTLLVFVVECIIHLALTTCVEGSIRFF